MIKNKGILLFVVLYLVAFTFKGIYGSYINVYLKEVLEFSYAQISFIGFASAIATMVLTPIMGMLVSKFRRDRWFIIGCYIVLMIVSLAFASGPTFMFAVVLGLLYEGFNESSQPILDSYTIIYLESEQGNYGTVRGMGSLGFMLGSLIGGLIISVTGFMHPIFYAVIVVILFSIILVLKLPPVTINQESKVNLKRDIPALIKNKRYNFIVLFSVLVISSAFATGSFTSMHMISVFEVPQSMIGVLTIVMVLPEVFLIHYSGKIENKIGFKKIFLLGSLAFTFRWLGYAISPNIYWYLSVSVFHAVGIAFVLVPGFSYIRKICTPGLFASAMSLYMSSIFLFNAIFKLIFGIVADATSTHVVFLIGASITFIGIGYLLVFIKE